MTQVRSDGDWIQIQASWLQSPTLSHHTILTRRSFPNSFSGLQLDGAEEASGRPLRGRQRVGSYLLNRGALSFSTTWKGNPDLWTVSFPKRIELWIQCRTRETMPTSGPKHEHRCAKNGAHSVALCFPRNWKKEKRKTWTRMTKTIIIINFKAILGIRNSNELF